MQVARDALEISTRLKKLPKYVQKQAAIGTISEHAGHGMTYKIWNKETDRIIHRSNVRSALEEGSQNIHVGDDPFNFVKSE